MDYTKVELRRAMFTFAVSHKDVDVYIKETEALIESKPDCRSFKACLFIAKKIKELGYTQETVDKIYESIDNGTL